MKNEPRTTKKTPARSWHRQPDETDRQFELFEFFLSLKPADRTSQTVGQHFAVSRRYIQQVRDAKKWNDRARDRDNFVAEKGDAAIADQAAKVAFDWAEYEQEQLDNAVELSRLFAVKAIEIAKMPIVEETETIVETSPDGKTVHKTIVRKPLKVTASDAPKFAEAALILSRYATEQADAARRGSNVNIHLPKPDKPIDQMTKDERETYIAECMRARQAMERGDDLDLISGAEQ